MQNLYGWLAMDQLVVYPSSAIRSGQMQAVNYEILKGKDPETLEEKVNEKLKRGWVLVGGPFSAKYDLHHWFYQAVALPII